MEVFMMAMPMTGGLMMLCLLKRTGCTHIKIPRISLLCAAANHSSFTAGRFKDALSLDECTKLQECLKKKLKKDTVEGQAGRGRGGAAAGGSDSGTM